MLIDGSHVTFRLAMKSPKRQFGDIGEGVACMFLEKHGFKIIERNYLKKWGEIDIVARKGNVVHFVEVKSVSSDLPAGRQEQIRPEENMHPGKIRRLHRVIQTYIIDKKIDSDWQLDLLVVRIDKAARRARAEILENIV